MFLVDAQRTNIDESIDVFVSSEDYVPVNKIPFRYTVKLNETLPEIQRIELLDRDIPTTSRYVFAVPVPSGQTTAQAKACVPGIVYSSFDGVNRVHALITRLGDLIANTTSGSTTQRLAYALPIRGAINPTFTTDVTNWTVVWNQPLTPSTPTTTTVTRGSGLTDAVFLRIEKPPLQLKVSFGPDTSFRHAMTPAVHHDTFWYFGMDAIHFPTDVNINRYLRRPVTSDYMNVLLLVDGEPLISPFDIVYGSSPVQILYLPHYWHFRLYFKRKTM